MISYGTAKIFFQQNIYLNKDKSKGLMEMRGKDAREGGRENRNTFRNSHQEIIDAVIEKARMTAVAVIFVGTILAIELFVVGVCYLACGR